jgi:hypothetical protein
MRGFACRDSILERATDSSCHAAPASAAGRARRADGCAVLCTAARTSASSVTPGTN